MRARRSGRVIAVTSLGGTLGQPFNDAYCAAKFAVEGLFESLYPLEARFEVYTSIVEPGPVATEFTSKSQRPTGDSDPEIAMLRGRYEQMMAAGKDRAQPAEAAAEVIVTVSREERPLLRYQTSSLHDAPGGTQAQRSDRRAGDFVHLDLAGRAHRLILPAPGSGGTLDRTGSSVWDMDVIIRGGTVVDGTGAPGRRADVGIEGGRIVAIGEVDGHGARVLDADGLVVAPGFIDVHVHYDAQVLWDPSLTPSIYHGITTMIGGNCGFTLGQAGPEDAEYLVRLLARVEGIPLEALEAGVDWCWKDTAGYFEQFEGRTGPNIGFLAGHSTIRRSVMGERCIGGTATEDDLVAMERLLAESLAAGALGFSSSNAGDPQRRVRRPGAVPFRQRGGAVPTLLEVVAELPGDHHRVHPGQGRRRDGQDDRDVPRRAPAAQLEHPADRLSARTADFMADMAASDHAALSARPFGR